MEGERGKRRLWPWLAVLAVLGGLAAYNYWPAEPDKILISRETTYILRPLNADGTPNYVKYLDDKCAEGVTAANNAAPLLLRAFGPDMLPAEIRSETLRRLKLPADIFDGDKHFIKWEDRARPAKADASATGDTNDANSPAHTETDEDESANEPKIGDVFNMLLAGQVHPDLEAWLAENAGPLELVCQAAARDKFYLPIVSTRTPWSVRDVVSPDVKILEETARALAVRAILKSVRNDMQGAWDDVLAAHKIARLLDQSPFLGGRLVGCSADEIAAQAGIAMGTRVLLLPGQARELLDTLVAVEPRGDIVDIVDGMERFRALDLVMEGFRDVRTAGDGNAGLSVFNDQEPDWNQMLRDVTAMQDHIAKPFHLPRFQGREEARKALYEKCEELADRIRSSDIGAIETFLLQYGGRLVRGTRTDIITDWALCETAVCFWDYSPSLEDSQALADQAKMTYEIETLTVALACFHAEQGRWPAELKELCPSLLKEIPADRFSTNSLIYRPGKDGYLLYSVGKNLRDDGGQCDPRGSGKSSEERKDDIVAEVKPAEATSMPAETASKPATSQP